MQRVIVYESTPDGPQRVYLATVYESPLTAVGPKSHLYPIYAQGADARAVRDMLQELTAEMDSGTLPRVWISNERTVTIEQPTVAQEA